jgi:hypothetical protein
MCIFYIKVFIIIKIIIKTKIIITLAEIIIIITRLFYFYAIVKSKTKIIRIRKETFICIFTL